MHQQASKNFSDLTQKKKWYQRCRKGEEAVREGGKEVSYPTEKVTQKRGVTDKIKLGK